MRITRTLCLAFVLLMFVACQKDVAELDPIPTTTPPTPLVAALVHYDPAPDIVVASCDSFVYWQSPMPHYIPSGVPESLYDSLDLDLDSDIDVVIYAHNWYSFQSNTNPQSNYKCSISISSPDSTVEFPKTGFPIVPYLDSLDTIDANLSNWIPSCFITYQGGIPAGGSFYGVKYIPFRFVAGNNQYRYGWLRMQNFGILPGYQYYLTDWGYNQTPNMLIAAGEF